MTSYSFEITNDESGAYLAKVEGSLRVVRAAYEDAFPKDFTSNDDFTVSFYKTAAIGENVNDKITSITADLESVKDIVSGRLNALRKTDPDVPARKPRGSRASAPATESNTESNAEGVAVTDETVSQY